MALSDLLTTVDVATDAPALVAVDPMTRFVYVATANGPERRDSAFRRVEVPIHDWQAQGVNEDDEIVKTLTEASAMNPLKVPSPSAVDERFWVTHRGWRALFCNASLLGKFVIPEAPLVMVTDHVAPTQIVLVGPPQLAGFFVRQGARRGVVTNNAQGLLQIQFSVV